MPIELLVVLAALLLMPRPEYRTVLAVLAAAHAIPRSSSSREAFCGPAVVCQDSTNALFLHGDRHRAKESVALSVSFVV